MHSSKICNRSKPSYKYSFLLYLVSCQRKIGVYSCIQRDRRTDLASAVQFRMGGCKGVLALDPRLGDKDVIVIRPSMEKFKCNDQKLEAISFSKPRKSHFLMLFVCTHSGI